MGSAASFKAPTRSRFETVSKPVDAHRVTVDLYLGLRQLAALFCFLQFELDGDVLTCAAGRLGRTAGVGVGIVVPLIVEGGARKH